MKILNAVLLVTCLCLMLSLPTLPATAQPPEGETPPEMAEMMAAWQEAMTPGEPHEWLAKSVGSWKLTVKTWMPTGGEPEVTEGTAEREMILGGRYLEERVTGTAMGMPFEGYSIAGYNNVTAEYWGTWIDNLSTGLMTMTGERDGNTVVWHAEGTDPMTGGKAKMKMVSMLQDDGKEKVEFYEMHGGEEMKTMEILYQRE